MKKIFHIFKVKKEEKWIASILFLIIGSLNVLTICHYYKDFTPIANHYYGTFIKHFQVSGFDPLTYYVLSNWETSYNVFRHPLLAFYMYIPYLINMGLMKITGINCALFIAVAIQLFCAFYSGLFMTRIYREIIGLGKWTAQLLTLFFFSFGYILVTSLVPDHFIISMMLLLLALYISGHRMIHHHKFKIWQSIVYFFLTAGTSLNNGLKIFLSALFVNGKDFFRIKHLTLAVIMPAALIWGFCQWEYKTFAWPKEMRNKEIKAKKIAAQNAKIAQLKLIKDSLIQDSIERGFKRITKQQLSKKKREPKMGAPISKTGFMGWTDVTTSRTQSIIENLFGEGIQLHQDYLLQDELRGSCNRPMFFGYRHWWNYGVEAIICLLFLFGIWCGRKYRYLWLAMSYFGLDMLLHLGLGFGLNEVYIMSAHWMYVIPIAIAFSIKKSKPRQQKYLTVLIAALTLYLLVYNGSLIISYFS